MKSVLKLTFIAGMTFLLSAGVAYGQSQSYGTDDPGIEKRMENQEQRIQQGINSGQLTPKEAGRLEAQEAKIKQDELRMKSDGNLSPAERQKLNRELDKASNNIYREKHDAQTVNVGQGTSQGTSPAGNVNDPGIEKRMADQEKRIQQGINSGQLTPKEAGRLEAQEAKIKQDELRMKSDGNLSPAERQKLNRELDKASNNIYREKHDAQTVNVGKGTSQATSQAGNVNDSGIEKRMENQQRRIQQGIDSGQLTPREAGRLKAQEAKIKQDELRMKSDGKLTADERRKLNRELDKESKRIHKEKHNRQHVSTK